MSSKNKITSVYKQATEHYNKLSKEMNHKIEMNQDYEFNFIEDNGKHIIEVYSDKKLKLKAEYNVIGLYNIPFSMWYWSWNIAFLNKDLYEELNKIKQFNDKLNKDYDQFDPKEADELHYLLSNDNYYISSGSIEKLMKVVLYITNGLWIFPINHTNAQNVSEQLDRIEYILITKILQIS